MMRRRGRKAGSEYGKSGGCMKVGRKETENIGKDGECKENEE